MRDPELVETLQTSTNPVEQLTFYNGEVTLFYDDRLHVYYTVEDGVRVVAAGVTDVVHMIDKSAALMQWAANQTSERIRSLLKLDQGITLPDILKDHTAESLDMLIHEARLFHRSVAKDAASVGRAAHDWLEGYLKTRIAGHHYAAALPADERAANCVMDAIRWMEKHKFHPIQSERRVYSRTYGYAGTLDWIALITGCGDPKCCPFVGEVRAIGDFKSSNGLYDSYRAQLAAYQYAWEEEFPDELIAVRVLLKLGKTDGKFDSQTLTHEGFESDFDGFLGTLQMYFWTWLLEADRRNSRAYDKAVKKMEKGQAKAKRVRRPKMPVSQPIPVES